MDESNWDMTFMTASPGQESSPWAQQRSSRTPTTSSAPLNAPQLKPPAPPRFSPSAHSSLAATAASSHQPSSPDAMNTPLRGRSDTDGNNGSPTSAALRSSLSRMSLEVVESFPPPPPRSPSVSPPSKATAPTPSRSPPPALTYPAQEGTGQTLGATRTPFRPTNRRVSSPLNLNASMLDASFAPPDIGDKTYDELEVAVEKNTRRRSIGLALLAPLPPSPTSSDDWGSPEQISRLRPMPHSPSTTLPAEHASNNTEKPVPATASGRSVRELARTYDMPPPPVTVTPAHELMPPPPIPNRAQPAARSNLLRSLLPAPMRSSPLRARTDTPEQDEARQLDESTMFPVMDKARQFHRLDESTMDGPALLDAASFRLTPPKARPSAMSVFDERGAPPMSTLRTPARTPKTPGKADQTIDIAQLLLSARPQRTHGMEESVMIGAQRLAEADELAALSDDEEMVPATLRPKHRGTALSYGPTGSSHQATGLEVTAEDTEVRSASLSHVGTNGLPQGMPKSQSTMTISAVDGDSTLATGGLPRSRSAAKLDATKVEPTRKVGITRSNSARSVGVARSNSTQRVGMARSNSTRTVGGISRSDSLRSVGIARSDSTRSIGGMPARTTGITRSNSVRTIAEGDKPAPARPSESRDVANTRDRLAVPPSTSRVARTLPPSSARTPARSSRLPPSPSRRRLATTATPVRPRDRPDVPLTMRKTSSQAPRDIVADRWANAVERDAPALRRAPATAPVQRRLPASAGARGVAATSGASTSAEGDARAGQPTSRVGIQRSGSARSLLSRPLHERSDREKASAPPALARMPRSGSGGSLSRGSGSVVSSTTSTSTSRAGTGASLSRGGAAQSATEASGLPSRAGATAASRSDSLARRTSVVPARASAGPVRPTTTPARQSTLAARPTTTPARQSTIASRQSTAPARQSLAPARQSAAPTRQTLAPRPSVAPAAQVSSATRRSVAPTSTRTPAPATASRASAPPLRTRPLSDVAPLANAAGPLRRATPSAGAALARTKLAALGEGGEVCESKVAPASATRTSRPISTVAGSRNRLSIAAANLRGNP